MGSSSSSLSRAHCRYSRRAHHHGEVTRVSSKRRADEFCQPPQLKPCIVYNDNDQRPPTQLHISQGSEAAVPKTTGDKRKVLKKVRFTDEILLISSATPENDPLLSTHVNEGKISEEVLHGRKDPSSIFTHPSTILMYQSSMELNETRSLGRVKVVISKKELSDLILKTREKQSSEADFMERTLLPLLSHQGSFTKFSTIHSHIHEDPRPI